MIQQLVAFFFDRGVYTVRTNIPKPQPRLTIPLYTNHPGQVTELSFYRGDHYVPKQP